MQILDGKLVAQSIKDSLKKIMDSTPENHRPPHLVAILVGNEGASETYVANKIKSCKEVGFESTLIRMEDSVTQMQLLETIKKLNRDSSIDGILVQMPLPAHIDEEAILEHVDPSKDVDGFHPVNAGKMMQGTQSFVPATPFGIMLILEHYGIDTNGMHAVVIGRSNIVGRPVSVLLSQNKNPGNCTVTLCHSRTRNLKDLCQQADIIVAALGKPGFLKADMVKKGAIIIDVGITRVPDQSKKSGFILKGDVDFENVAPLSSYITPVPGGVGPMTIAALLKNTHLAWSNHEKELLPTSLHP